MTKSGTGAANGWGVNSEYGKLHDVLLCEPVNFKWLPTSSISKATLRSGAKFDRQVAMRQHREMAQAYEDAGVTVHMRPDEALPYQVYARDSRFMTPYGAVVTQMHQWWRRGEYAPVIKFYQSKGIPIFKMITALGLRRRRLRHDRARHGAHRLLRRTHAGAGGAPGEGLAEEKGWEVKLRRSPSTTSIST